MITTDLDIENHVKGTYILIARLTASQEIEVGRLGIIKFPRAYYAYVGSALGGLKSRLQRHTQKEKKKRWHIDYLLEQALLVRIVYGVCESTLECQISQYFTKYFTSIPRFGASDCRCTSHLYRDARVKNMQKIGKVAFHNLGIEPHEVVVKRMK
ncbi:MAG: GIY-YIG nuclease family protein [Thermodesulfobacteriota bacterium]|nr:GIY-YIG nuclease family protein [Thermodesulfobacteriota bacterium]